MAHSCNLSTLGPGKEDCEFKVSLDHKVKLKKRLKKGVSSARSGITVPAWSPFINANINLMERPIASYYW